MNWWGFDYINYIYPALQAFLAGGNPYTNPEVGVPPWTFIVLSPLGLLPVRASLAALNLITIAGLAALFLRRKRRWLALPAALSFPFIALLVFSNLEGLVLWGLALGGPLGLILLAVKPQAAGLVGVIWLVKAWREGGWKAAFKLTAPLAVLAAVSLALYPDYLRNLFFFTGRTDGVTANGFPWLVPLGVGLFVAALRQGREDWAALATVLVFPYLRVQSWSPTLALLVLSDPLEGSIAALASWIGFIRMLPGK